jgi:hypothetical protein
MDIERYAVAADPDEWGDAPLYDNYQEAKDDARRQGACVITLTYEYSDSEVTDDFRDREPEPIPADFPVQPIDPDDPTAKDPATCGTCGRSWDDGKITSMTPAPGGRCPFEYYH